MRVAGIFDKQTSQSTIYGHSGARDLLKGKGGEQKSNIVSVQKPPLYIVFQKEHANIIIKNDC